LGTVSAFRHSLDETGVGAQIAERLKGVDIDDGAGLQAVAGAIREQVAGMVIPAAIGVAAERPPARPRAHDRRPPPRQHRVETSTTHAGWSARACATRWPPRARLSPRRALPPLQHDNASSRMRRSRIRWFPTPSRDRPYARPGDWSPHLTTPNPGGRMSGTRGSATLLRSLAAITEGDSMRIREIHFGQLRSDCAAIGLHVADVVTCRSTSPRLLQLRSDRGPTILLPCDWARWIEVEPSDG
jgi:hypothetical protein